MESTASGNERRLRHTVVCYTSFLPDHDVGALYAGILARERDFIPSFTHDDNPDVRRSLVLNPPRDLVAPVVDRVHLVMPQVLDAIRLPKVVVGVVEAQVTANTDGSYFGVHTDANYDSLALRHLTYVYYLNGTPKAFDGGELRVYDDFLRNNKLARSDSFQTVEPAHNTIVFFWARAMHEVAPVRVPSRAFADSRFTVNGWVNKARA
ncbi:MAG TPA: 2OG-Fe(II) oxygenase [Casimicrobiaceae bacterium]|nr:2OG-Fe(II) oxygenase [Casimicrobiaceae bacterium]